MRLRRSFLVAFLLLQVFGWAEKTPPSPSTPAEELTVAPGFKVELLRSASKEEGSWICMAIDDRGRLYVASQAKKRTPDLTEEEVRGGLWRATLDAQGHIAQWDKVPVPIGDAMGMLWAFNSLYVSGEGPEGRGIYRLKDSKGTDTLDAWTLFKKVPGGDGEHGAHALVLAPDGKSIYVVNGNATAPIEGVAADSPFRNFAEDDLLPRVKDPSSPFGDRVKSPYGCIYKTDENGTKWKVIAGGMRNAYDIAFNADGELFTYDSDTERDVGVPWYRPTRILHIVPGGEYGFREGTSKWPQYYADSLPPVVNIGLGCPTGVRFGTQSNFPAKYQKALFVLDWTFGRILAIHLHPTGASYTAQNEVPPYRLTGPLKSDDVEEFLRGKGMPVTALQFGKDGAMYFTVGGRGTQAALYRVSWARRDAASGDPVLSKDEQGILEKSKKARVMRELMEIASRRAWARKIDRGLSSFWGTGWDDRFLNYSRRLALEAQNVAVWREPALVEKDPPAALTALLALARVGTKEDQEALLKSLSRLSFDSLGDEFKLEKLRVIEVALARQGRPNSDLVQMSIVELSHEYPASGFPLNRELCELLVYLGAPDVVEKTLKLLEKSEEPCEQIWYALCLREATNWTPAQRAQYFAWFSKMQDYHGGGSAKKYILRIRDEALEKVSEADRPALLALAEKTVEKPNPGPIMPARPFVKAWTFADLELALAGVSQGRDFARGKKLFGDLLCAQCHTFAGTGGLAKGGSVEPDLTAVGSRFGARDILGKILDPSKAINEQYASYLFTLNDGSVFGGQIADENHFLVTLVVDPFNGTKENIPKNGIKKREVSPVSLMPPGLLFTLTQDEVLDLLAYLQSAGDEKAASFAK